MENGSRRLLGGPSLKLLVRRRTKNVRKKRMQAEELRGQNLSLQLGQPCCGASSEHKARRWLLAFPSTGLQPSAETPAQQLE